MHMYKLRLKAIIGAFNKKRCIISTFKSGRGVGGAGVEGWRNDGGAWKLPGI